MSVQKTGLFLMDVENQFEWYALNANWDVANAYLQAVEGTCQLLGQHPELGPVGGFSHPRLREWRFFLIIRPFQKHILFYEVVGSDVLMRRAMHGHRNLPKRLLEEPGQ